MKEWLRRPEYNYLLQVLDESIQEDLSILSNCEPTDIGKVATIQASIRYKQSLTSGEMAEIVLGELEENERRNND
jgi:hypothetical protein